MRLNEEPRLPRDAEGLQWTLTRLLREAFRQVNSLTERVDTPITAAASVTVGASPYSYTASAGGLIVVRGGTVSQIEYGRQGAYTVLGITAGLIPIKNGDIVRITYTVAPTVDFIQQ